MELLELQKEAWQRAIIGLSIMSLSTLILHTLLNLSSSLSPVEKPQPRDNPSAASGLIIGVGIVVVFLWIACFIGWIIYLGIVSASARNIAFIYGVTAASAALAYLLLFRSTVTGEEYMAFTLWPLYGGVMVGTLML